MIVLAKNSIFSSNLARNFMDSFSSKIKKYLDRLADSPKKPNSFLFVGSERMGKEEAAYYFISKLAGKDGDAGFIEKIKDKIHPDVVVIEPETEEKKGRKREKEIGISQVKDARERLKFFPYELKKKFCLIKHANRLNREASNALLKVLEEPSADAFFILLSPGLDSVLPTIQSRCAALRFPQTNLPRWNEENREKLRQIFAEEVYQRFEYVEEKSKDRNEIISILEDWEMLTGESIRKIMLESRGGGAEKRSRQPIQKLLLFLNNLRETTKKIQETNTNPRTACEKLALDVEWK